MIRPAARALLLLVAPLAALAQDGDPFMGRWAGTYRTESAEQGPFCVDVIPQGGGAYLLAVRMGERGSRYEVPGRREGDALRFRGRFQAGSGTDEAAYDLTGAIERDRLTGAFSSPEATGTIELAKVRPAGVARKKIPAGAVVLFDGASLDRWRSAAGGAAGWPVRADGSLEAGAADLVTREDFSGYRLHLEFLLPLRPEARGRQRANSGVVLGGACEVFILDSFGQDPSRESCGAILGVAAPRVDACHPPLTWQALDLTLRAPAGGGTGQPAQLAEITVALNGVVLHDGRKLDAFRPAPIRLRSGGSPVRFRNVWLQPLAE